MQKFLQKFFLLSLNSQAQEVGKWYFYQTFHRYIFNLHMPKDEKTHMIIRSHARERIKENYEYG